MSWTPLHVQVQRMLRSRHLLPPQAKVLVAVSGGQDSLCLIRLLLDLQRHWQWQLAIAHCDHRWRSDSSANAEYVEQLAQSWQIPCHRRTAEQVSRSEAEARQWRYEVLGDIAVVEGYAWVVTGHTASDRAETLLYNLIRGSGTDGLQALTWQRPLLPGVTLVRPLLAVSRSETAAFCQQCQLQVWEDATNQDLHYRRNRIRQELLPYLQTHFNPQVEKAIAQTAELLQAETEYLEQAATQLYQQAHHPTEPGLNRRILNAAPLALQRRTVRQFLEKSLPHAPNFDQIQKFTHLITAPNRARSDPFPGRVSTATGEMVRIAEVQGDWIFLQQSSK